MNTLTEETQTHFENILSQVVEGKPKGFVRTSSCMPKSRNYYNSNPALFQLHLFVQVLCTI